MTALCFVLFGDGWDVWGWASAGLEDSQGRTPLRIALERRNKSDRRRTRGQEWIVNFLRPVLLPLLGNLRHLLGLA